jgi:diguanylate cyclase (GGDEF)-like protein/PAS domain S-box-containing protein
LAIVLAALEATFSSWRFCSKKITVFFNAASAAISTASVMVVLTILGLWTEPQLHGYPGKVADFVIALSVMAITQFVVNTSLAAIYDAISSAESVWITWKQKYVWASITYLVGACCAGVLVKLSDELGYGVILAAFPVILLLYFTYRMYLANVTMSLKQAEQAAGYAQELEDRSVALRDSEQRFRSAFTYAPIGIGLVSTDGQWLRVNNALCEILGYDEDEILRMRFKDLSFPEDHPETVEAMRNVLGGSSSSRQLEMRLRHRSGKTVWISLSISAIDDIHSTNASMIFQIQDITEKKIAEERLVYEASHDALTGLPNRTHFMRRLDAALEKTVRNPKYKVSVLFIDLDRFKYVNDSLGHHVGDELLIAIAQRLSASMRPPDMVARLGGDEFVVLVEGRYYGERITRIAERIQRKINTPFKITGHEVFSSASIGILNATEQHKTADDIIRDADTAMYFAKRAGKARHEVFDDTMRDAARETLRLETDLRRAVANDELEVWYQPIYSLRDDKLIGLEALARWNHPSLGVVSPQKFIPLAEEIGLIENLGESIVRLACTQMSSIRSRIPETRDLRMSINLSCRQFADEHLVARLQSVLDDTLFPSDRLNIEITETAFLEHHAKAFEMLKQLSDMGVQTDVDDFGTGYSNLAYLVTLPISTLKIDRSFVSKMAEDAGNREVVKTIILLAANLGLRVVAEGIETKEQHDTLVGMGCQFGQGYFFSKPLNAERTSDLLERVFESNRPLSTVTDVPEIRAIQ